MPTIHQLWNQNFFKTEVHKYNFLLAFSWVMVQMIIYFNNDQSVNNKTAVKARTLPLNTLLQRLQTFETILKKLKFSSTLTRNNKCKRNLKCLLSSYRYYYECVKSPNSRKYGVKFQLNHKYILSFTYIHISSGQKKRDT